MTLDFSKVYAALSDVQAQHSTEVAAAVATQKAADQVVIDGLNAQVAAFQAQVTPETTAFSFNLSRLAGDGDVAEATKISSHKSALGLSRTDNMREFFQPGQTLSWSTERLAACQPGDGVLISMKDHPRNNGFATWVKNMPDKFRQRPGQVKFAFQHEGEKQMVGGSFTLQAYLDAYQFLADTGVSTGLYTPDDVVRIFLWYSAVIDATTKGKQEQMIGSQNFGLVGMDCYNYVAWANQQDRYATAQELLDPVITLGKNHSLPVCVPEWGAAVLAATDTDATRLASTIKAQGAYMKDNGVLFANWWCGQGAGDGSRNQHLERFPVLVDAYKSLRA